MLTLFHSPGSCSNGILYLLEEAGVAFDTQVVNVRAGDQNTPKYRAQNPKGKVPALKLTDGTVLTEFQSIAYWIGQSIAPQLWPAGILAQTRTLAALDFMVGSVHMRGFTFVKVPQKFVTDPSAQDALRSHGRAQVDNGLKVLSDMLAGKDYLMGQISIADGALFYILDWAVSDGFELPDNLAACLARLRARPAFAGSVGQYSS